MYFILYEGLKIESNEPVYCTVYTRRARFVNFSSLHIKLPSRSE